MYMNISESLGEKAIRHFLNEHPELLHDRFSVEFVIEATLLILRNNVSYFDGEYRRQVHGCAMGSHKSPPFSSLAIGYLEKELVLIQRNIRGDDYANYLLRMLRRFLDDIFLKWKNSLGNPSDLLLAMNSLDPKIKFTMESGDSLPFLDVKFTLESDNSLSTDIYYKETDSHNYVPFFSFHPKKTLSNIPYSLARRICTIVSKPVRRDDRLDELRIFLRRKAYPDSLISNGIERARAIERQILLSPQTQTSSGENIPFIFTNNSANPQVLDLVRSATHMLAPSPRMSEVMSGKKIPPLQTSF